MSNRARTYASAISGNTRVEQRKHTQSDVITDIMDRVNTTYGPTSRYPNQEKVDFATTHCNKETLSRNMAYTAKCPKMISSLEGYISKGYTFRTNVPDKHSRIVGWNSQDKQETIRLCTDPYCTYYHNEEYKRATQLCVYDLFGVCKHSGPHHNLVHGGCIKDLPSFCIKHIKCEEYSIFFYHDMLRYYDTTTKKTYVYEFTNRDTEDDCIMNITNVLTKVARNELMNKLCDICHVVHRLVMYSTPLPFSVCEIKDENTCISSIPQLFGAYIYHTIQTVSRLQEFSEDSGKITGMLMEMDNIELVKCANVNKLHERCIEAHTVLQEEN